MDDFFDALTKFCAPIIKWVWIIFISMVLVGLALSTLP